MLDKSLIVSLGIKDGLLENDFLIKEKKEQKEQKTSKELSSISNELYRKIRDEVQIEVRQRFSLEETSSQKARTPVVKGKFQNIVDYKLKQLNVEIEPDELYLLYEKLFSDIIGYGVLEKYINDPEINEIIVTGTKINIERNGQEEDVEEEIESIEQGIDLVRRMVSHMGERIDPSKPIVEARLFNGARLSAQITPITPDELLISIRKFKYDLTPEQLLERGAVSPEVMDFLCAAVQCRMNILVAGGTSAGKTTWLNAMASFLDKRLKVITIENPAELNLQHPKIRRLEAKPPNIEGKGEFTISDGIIASLRMAPDIIIVGEVRDKEAFDLLNAMGTGHEGSMGTLHANNAKHALEKRMLNMIKRANTGMTDDAILDQIADIIDIVVYVVKDRKENGRRRIDHIVEVAGVTRATDGRVIGINVNELFRYDRTTKKWKWVAKEFLREERLREVDFLCPC